MSVLDGVRINEAEYYLENGKKGKLAVFIYGGNDDPKPILNYAIKIYVEDNNYYELIDSQLNCPCVRVVMSNIDDMTQYNFDDYYKNIILKSERKKKLKNVNFIE